MDVEAKIAEAFLNQMVLQSVEDYRISLLHGDEAKAVPVYGRAMRIFRELPSEKQAVLVDFLKVVAMDAISGVLGAVGGTTELSGFEEGFHLSYAGKTMKDLQEYFLVKVEEKGLLG